MHYPLPTFFFFFNDTPTTKISTLSLHDALPISQLVHGRAPFDREGALHQALLVHLSGEERHTRHLLRRDRKSTRLNSSHMSISYAVFCLKKKTITSL